MSWLFSQALVAAYSGGNCLDGEPSAQLNVMPTPHKFWHRDKMMESSSHSRFGLMCAVLTADRGEALLMSYLAGFRVRTSAQRDEAQESMENDLDYGQKWPGLFAIFDRDSSSWKTPQYSLLGGLDVFSETWPRSGTMRDGQCYLLPMSERRTSESASGLLPTPTATNAHQGLNSKAGGNSKGKPLLPMAAMMWPTPTASMMTAADMEQAKYHSSKRPTYQDAKTMERNSRPLSEQIGGQLNPTWVEWLMGWPIGWTDLEQ